MFLDIGIGILTSVWVSNIFGIHFGWPIVILGILFALFVDVDFLFHASKNGGRRAHEHRYLMHYPLLYISIGMLLLYAFLGLPTAVLFGLCSLFHFIHDSIGIGWGVQWLYPFSSDHYAFLYIYKPKDKEGMPTKLFYHWRHQDIAALDERYGDSDWIKNIYYHWHPYAIVEFGVFVLSLAALYFKMKGY